MEQEIDLLGEINDLAKDFAYDPEVPVEEPSEEVEVKTDSASPEAKVEEVKADVDVDTLVKAKVKEVEDRYAAELGKRADISKLDPEDYFKQSGQDIELFLKRQLLARAKDGTPLKEQLQKELAADEPQREVKKLRAEIAAKEAAEAQRKYVQDYTNSARDFVSKLDEKVAPTMSRLVAAGESDWVLNELISEVRSDAQERYARGDSGEPLTAQEALKRVETRYAKLAKAFVPKEPEKKVLQKKTDVVVKTPTPPAEDFSASWVDKMLKEAEVEWHRESKKTN